MRRLLLSITVLAASCEAPVAELGPGQAPPCSCWTVLEAGLCTIGTDDLDCDPFGPTGCRWAPTPPGFTPCDTSGECSCAWEPAPKRPGGCRWRVADACFAPTTDIVGGALCGDRARAPPGGCGST